MKVSKEEYEPFGEEWKAEIKKANKDFIIELASKLGNSLDDWIESRDNALIQNNRLMRNILKLEKERDELKEVVKTLEEDLKEASEYAVTKELKSLKDALKDYFDKMGKGEDYNGHHKRQENLKTLIK